VDEKEDDAKSATAKAKAFAASLKTARQATIDAVAGGDKDDPFNMAAYDDEPDGASTFLQGEKVIAPEVILPAMIAIIIFYHYLLSPICCIRQ
jgi:hypothetical protein